MPEHQIEAGYATAQSVHWTPIIVCSGHLLLVSPGYYLLKCTGDTNFGVRIGQTSDIRFGVRGTLFFYSVRA